MEITADSHLTRLQAALVGRYTIDRELGRGGMACVYLARDLRLDRDVAIKVLRPELTLGMGAERFLREVRIEASLQHPHVVGLLDSGTVGPESPGLPPLPYYVMPYIAGESLRERLQRERQLPLDESLDIVRQVGDALTYAHGHGVVHRDVKPANILLAGGHAWVADFGLARAITVAAGDRLTETGLAVGTPDYMSPEQASGDALVDGRTDVYALACVLFEMLAGEPPFRGRTAQAVLARHRSEPPPSVRVLRPGIPEPMDAALRRALAKVPADRFRTVGDFLRALDASTGSSAPVPRRQVRPSAVRLALVVLALAGALAGYSLRHRFRPLDPTRVVVFPLSERPARGADEGSGEAVATYLGYALDGTAPLRWLDGRDFFDRRQRLQPDGIGDDEARAIARRARARYYLDGAVLRGPDSVTIILRLHDATGDSVLRRTGASADLATGSLPQLGLRAMGELLPALLEPGRRVDLSALSERNPAAITRFLRGEREYRHFRFGAALAEYRSAIDADSAFALAALKGGLAAMWLERSAEAGDLLAVAQRGQTQLPRKYRPFMDGLSSYWSGAADTAVRRFEQALAQAPDWTEAWMSLGEVYYHLLPRAGALDSLAEAAFVQAHRLDPDFTPALYHLVTAALRRGETAAARAYFDTLRSLGADSLQLPLRLTFDCLDHGPDSARWAEAARRDAQVVFEAAAPLITTPAQRTCARAAYRSVLQSPSLESRWGGLLGLQGLLVADGRYDELERLFTSPGAADLPGRLLYLWDAVADSVLDAPAAEVAKERGTDYATAMGAPNLWLFGEWEAHRGNAAAVTRIAELLDSLAQRGSRRDSVLARIMWAQAARVRGDTARALARLDSLTPSASRAELFWQPWEAMAGERLALAQLLMARRNFAAADQVAAGLDNHRSAGFLPYLRAALRVRVLAAAAMGNRALENQLRRRLASWRPAGPDPQ